MDSRTHLVRTLTSPGDVTIKQGDRKAARRFYQESLELARQAQPGGLAWWLEELAEDCAGRQPERAARLFGASAALRAAGAVPRTAAEEARVERALAAVRTALGEETFQAAWASGSAMDAEEAVQEALQSR